MSAPLSRTSQTTPPVTTQAAPRPLHSHTPTGLSDIQDSAHNQGNEISCLHWIKKKVIRFFQSLWSCFSSLFCPAATNSALASRVVNESPESRLNRRIERGARIINEHFDHDAFNTRDPLYKSIVVLKYNGQAVISPNMLSAGTDTLREQAIDQLRQLLSNPANREHENGTLQVDTFIFKKNGHDSFYFRHYYNSVQLAGSWHVSEGERTSMANNVTGATITRRLTLVLSVLENPDLLSQATNHALL